MQDIQILEIGMSQIYVRYTDIRDRQILEIGKRQILEIDMRNFRYR